MGSFVRHNDRVAQNPEARAHTRWMARYEWLRDTGDPEYPDEWRWEQCGGCAAYRPLDSSLGEDWDACLNAASPADGTLRFEHDGCDAFEPAEPGTSPFA